jgi:hypothetical protein
MSEGDLINLGRSITGNEVSWFAQVITITLAMIVGIYYFLGRAGLAMRIFAFAAYLIGMLFYLGEILVESNVKRMVLQQLKALPAQSPVAQTYVGVNESWLGHLTANLFNGAFWILTIGIFYLLFFWKRHKPD